MAMPVSRRKNLRREFGWVKPQKSEDARMQLVFMLGFFGDEDYAIILTKHNQEKP